MPTPEQLARIKLLATSPEELAYFFDQLTSPDWLTLLRDDGLLGRPPEPVEQGNGVMFPFWPASRYMVRIAAEAPGAVADALWLAHASRNPRVWWDTVDALLRMPPEYALRFIPDIKVWVHHPWHLALETSVAKLVRHLIVNGARTPAIELTGALASLLPPAGWRETDPWVVLDEYDYGKEIPPIARLLGAFGPAGPDTLVEELRRFLAAKYPIHEDGRFYDYSFIWRPAIEDHEQNWDFDREAKLLVAIRDGYEEALTRCPAEASAVVTSLLASEWPVVRRIGLHLLVSNGGGADALVGDVLTNRELLADDHHRHEFYRLLTRSFGMLAPDAQARFAANVREIADAAAARSAARESDLDPELIRKVVLRRWLTPVAGQLDEAGRVDLECSLLGTGEDPHPDFPSYHTSWMGSTSPISLEDLRRRTPEEVLSYLATWEEPRGLGPSHPSTEGLAQQLIELVAEAPDTFVPLGSGFLSLKPAYFDGYVNGLSKALQNGRAFGWEPVLITCRLAIAKVDEGSPGDADSSWGTVRMAIIRLLEKGLDGETSEIPIEDADRVWDLISVLVEDPDPTPTDEARFGPPNMDPNTYSLNTIRGMAFHCLFAYLLWHHRLMGKPPTWSIRERDPDASDVLDSHLNPERDSSIAVRAAYGWWLPSMLDLDADWVRDRAQRLVDGVADDLARACWEGFLFRSNPTPLALSTFAEAYRSYAEQLASLDAEPEAGHRPADPIHFFIDHLVKAWLWNPTFAGGSAVADLACIWQSMARGRRDRGGRTAYWQDRAKPT